MACGARLQVLEKLQACHSPPPGAPGGVAAAKHEAAQVILSAAKGAGLDAQTHHFNVHLSREALLRRFGRRVPKDHSGTVRGTNVVALLRAPRGDGKEAVVLTAEYTDGDADEHHIAEGDGSAAVLVSLMAALARVPWLSKDVIFLATPKAARGDEAVTNWLRDYHSYHAPMLRSGEIWAALALKLPDHGAFSTVGIAYEGKHGQYPNLDLVNVASATIRDRSLQLKLPIDHYTLSRKHYTRKEEMRRARVAAEWQKASQAQATSGVAAGEKPAFDKPPISLRGPALLQFAQTWAAVREWLGKAETALMPPMLVRQARSLRGNLVSQALGQPTGNHAAFKAFKIEALSLVAAPDRVLAGQALLDAPGASAGGGSLNVHDVTRYGQVVEQVVRSCSNLLERFHQSFFLWVLIDETHFLPPEKYLAPAGVILLAPIARAIALWLAASQRHEWRAAELSLVLLAYLTGAAALLALEYTRGGLWWQLAVTPILGAYMHLSGLLLPPSKDAILQARAKAQEVKKANRRAGGKELKAETALAPAGPRLRPPRGARPGEVDVSYNFCWHMVRAQCLVLQVLFLATLCLTNFSFGLLASVAILPMTLLGLAPRHASLHMAALVSLICLLSVATVAIVFPDPALGGLPGGGWPGEGGWSCLGVLHCLVLLPAVLLLAVQVGEGLDENDNKRFEEWEFQP